MLHLNDNVLEEKHDIQYETLKNFTQNRLNNNKSLVRDVTTSHGLENGGNVPKYCRETPVERIEVKQEVKLIDQLRIEKLQHN